MKLLHLFFCTNLLLTVLTVSRASPAFDAAMLQFQQNHFREAETSMSAVIEAEPTNAAAFHILARAIVGRLQFERPAKEEAEARAKEAARWIERATTLEPTNAAYLRDFGMSQITGVTSLKKGRKILEEALALDPKDPDIHECLATIYSAPWVLGGDKGKAAEHRRVLQELDPHRAILSEVNQLLWVAKDFPAAIALSEAQLKREPESVLSLFVCGYVAATTKTGLDRGLASLQKAVTLPAMEPTGTSAYSDPFMVTPSNCWEKIGEIEGQLGHGEASRAAYATAVKLDPANYWAAQALEKTKPE